jgi:hypothetical protein
MAAYVGSNMANAEKALKEFFIEPARTQLDERSGPFLAEMEKSTKEVAGFQIKMPIKYGRSGGIGNRADDGDTPEPQARKWEHAIWNTKNIFATIRLTDKLLKASRNDKYAFANQLASQMEDIIIDANDSLRRQLFGDGSGKMATCGVNTSVNLLTVDSVQYLQEGQVIDILQSDGTPIAEGRTILSRDKANNQILIDGAAVTTAATDIITLAENYNMELTGMDAVFNSGSTLYNIDRSTHKWFDPNVKALNGELDEIVMQEMIDEADAEMGSQIDFIMCGYGVARAFQYNQLTYKKNIDYTTLKGGYKVMKYGEIPLTREKYEKPGVMRFLSKENWKLYRMGDWDWMAEDGAILKKVSGKAAYEAVLVMYADIGCDKVRGQSLLTGITEH